MAIAHRRHHRQDDAIIYWMISSTVFIYYFFPLFPSSRRLSVHTISARNTRAYYYCVTKVSVYGNSVITLTDERRRTIFLKPFYWKALTELFHSSPWLLKNSDGCSRSNFGITINTVSWFSLVVALLLHVNHTSGTIMADGIFCVGGVNIICSITISLYILRHSTPRKDKAI